MKTTAIYVRCSTSHHSQDVDSQLIQLKEFCANRGYKVHKIYSDYASGGTANREEFQLMFEDARKGKFNTLLFYSLDRFSREGVLATINHLQILKGYGVDYVSYSEQFIDSAGPFKDSLVAILSSLAQQQRVLQSERVKSGLRKSREKYGRIGGRPRICEDLQQKIFHLQNQELSNREIGRQLNVSYNTVRRYLAENGPRKNAA